MERFYRKTWGGGNSELNGKLRIINWKFQMGWDGRDGWDVSDEWEGGGGGRKAAIGLFAGA